MHEIVNHIYLGDIKDVENGKGICESVVSVYNRPINLSGYKNSISISVADDPTVDLVSHFPRVIDFISNHREENILIHCFAGSSRSVSVLIAYLLSESIIESVEEGIDLIVSKGGSPYPNEGFLEQLQLWIDMGCGVNPTHIRYKEFKLKQHQEQALLADGSDVNHLITQAPSELDAKCWKCKKCRRSLLRSESIIPHEEDAKVKKFQGKKHSVLDSKPKMKCSSVFTEALTWMEEICQGSVRGTLYCPKCRSKVGHFDWAGIQCSCGKWVSPAIQVQRKQVDEPPRSES